MKKSYNLITIKLKIANTESINDLFVYKTLISSFRRLQDLGIIKVDYFNDEEIEKVDEEIEKVDDWFEFCDHNKGNNK